MEKEQFEQFIGKKFAKVEYIENGVKIEFEKEEFVPKDGDFVKFPYGGIGIFKERFKEDSCIVY